MALSETLQTPVHIGPRRLGHANIFVTDLERSIEFYNQTCGFEIVMRQPQIKAGFLSNGNTHHDVGMIEVTKEALLGEGGHKILGPGQGAKPGLNHFGWEMESEFDLTRAYERAVAAQYQISRTVRHRSSHSVYIFDPDGNAHEFYADVDRDWRRLYSSKESISGEWRPGEKVPSMERLYDANPEIRRVETAPIHPNRITHATLTARNFEPMRSFFRNIAGLLEIYSCEDFAVFNAHGSNYPAAIILLKPKSNDGQRKIHHFSFQLASADELVTSQKMLEVNGINPVATIDASHKKSFFIKDPDGLLLEFYVPRSSTIEWDRIPVDGSVALTV